MTLQHKIVDALLVIVSLAIGFGVGIWYQKPAPLEPPTTVAKPIVLNHVENDKKQVVAIRDGERELFSAQSVKDVAAQATAKDFAGYEARYGGDCLSEVSKSPDGAWIIFSVGCPAGDLIVEWTGMYQVSDEKIVFLAAGAGHRFTWSADKEAVGYLRNFGFGPGGSTPVLVALDPMKVVAVDHRGEKYLGMSVVNWENDGSLSGCALNEQKFYILKRTGEISATAENFNSLCAHD